MTTAVDLSPIVEDLELPSADIDVIELDDLAPGRAGEITAALGRGQVLVVVDGLPAPERIAPLRDALWPGGHLTALYGIAADGAVRRHALAGDRELPARISGNPRTVLWVRDREAALGRATTVAKFDANATGWNGVPGTPTYGHYRWMRKLLADVADVRPGQRTLDAGCGAGWVGIEAALHGAEASAFDPSPEMVRIASENAQQAGVALDARVGFVEDVPFDEPFELVLNSGVISFAPDADDYLASLDAAVAPGGTLVIGDLNPLSRGFARRRKRPLLPARELNGLRREEVERGLQRRGYTLEDHWYYQLSFPIPEAMTVSEARFGGLGCGLALGLNKLATWFDHALGSRMPSQFDSWIIRARKGG